MSTPGGVAANQTIGRLCRPVALPPIRQSGAARAKRLASFVIGWFASA